MLVSFSCYLCRHITPHSGEQPEHKCWVYSHSWHIIVLYFQIKHCDDLGIPADKSSTLYLFIGIFSTLGRLGAGFLCDMKYINTLRLFQAATFIMGASTMLLTLAKTYAALVVYVITFSVADGMMVSTFIIKCMGSVEESKRASVIGFVAMAGAGFSLSSPPLSGKYQVN